MLLAEVGRGTLATTCMIMSATDDIDTWNLVHRLIRLAGDEETWKMCDESRQVRKVDVVTWIR